MIRRVNTAVLAALLTLAGVAATADLADAQVNYVYYSGTGYYYGLPPAGTYRTPYTPQISSSQTGSGSSSYTPAADPGAATYTPVRAWDGGWTISGYTSPAIQYYNSYRANPPRFRR